MDFDDTDQVPLRHGGRFQGLGARLPDQLRLYQGLVGDLVYADLLSVGDGRLYQARIVTVCAEAVVVCQIQWLEGPGLHTPTDTLRLAAHLWWPVAEGR